MRVPGGELQVGWQEAGVLGSEFTGAPRRSWRGRNAHSYATVRIGAGRLGHLGADLLHGPEAGHTV